VEKFGQSLSFLFSYEKEERSNRKVCELTHVKQEALILWREVPQEGAFGAKRIELDWTVAIYSLGEESEKANSLKAPNFYS